MTLVAQSHPSALTVEESHGFAEWEHAASGAFVPLHVQPQRPGPFDARMIGLVGPDAAAIRIDAGSHRVERTESLVAAGGAGLFKFGFQIAGDVEVSQGGATTRVRAGEVTVYDTSRPYTLDYADEASTLIVMVPHERMGASAPDVAQLCATSLGREGGGGAGLADAVVPVLRGLADRLGRGEARPARRLLAQAPGLLEAMCDDDAERLLGGRSGARDTELRAVLRYIEARLGDPALTPAAVAAAHFVSVRYLYKLFDDSGTTVAAWIRKRRLEEAHAELTDPSLRHVPVSRIGARWGLTDPAHFSRVYRSAYGASPSDARREALAA